MRRGISEAAKKQVLDRGVTAISRSHAPGSTEMVEILPIHTTEEIMANKLGRNGEITVPDLGQLGQLGWVGRTWKMYKTRGVG